MIRTAEQTANATKVLKQVEQIRHAKQVRDRTLALLAGAAVLATGMLIAMFIDSRLNLFSHWVRAIMTVITLAATAFCCLKLLKLGRQRNARLVPAAKDVDATYPILQERVSTLTSCKEDFAGSKRLAHPAMLRQVSEETANINQQVETAAVVSRRTMLTPAVGLMCAGLLFVIWLISDPSRTLVQLGRFWAPWSNLSVTNVAATDGDTVAARGESLKLTATLSGRPVESVTFFAEPVKSNSETAQAETRRLRPSTDDRTAVIYRQPRATDSFDYRFRAGDGQTQWHRVTVADRPRIEKIAMRVTPPAYTGFPMKEYRKMPRKLRLVTGSTVELNVKPTQAIKTARLVMGKTDWLPMEQDATGQYSWASELYQNVNFSVQLTELHGLKNKRPPGCNLQVVADQAPKIRILKPTRDSVVMPDETIDIHYRATDDIAIKEMSLRVYVQREGETDPVVHEVDIPVKTARNQPRNPRKVEGAIKLDLAQFKLEDGDSISYEVRATDNYEPVTGTKNPADTFPAIEATHSLAEATKVTPESETQAAEGTKPEESVTSKSATGKTADPTVDPTAQLANSRDGASDNDQKNSQSNPSKQVAQANSKAPDGKTPGDNQPNDDADLQNAAADTPNSTATENNSPEESEEAEANALAEMSDRDTDAKNPETGKPAGDAESDQPNRRTATAKTPPADNSANPANAKPTDMAQGKQTQGTQQPTDPQPSSQSAANQSSSKQKPSNQSASKQPASKQPTNGQPSKMPTPKQDDDAANQQSTEMADAETDPTSPKADPVQMQKRMMDVAGQSSSSGQRKMKIDEYGGSYQSRQREKLELAIAPVLEQMKKSLTIAGNHSYGVMQQIETGKAWIDRNDLALGATAGQLKIASEAVISLNKKTRDTPYAFVGLRLESIRLSDIAPAWEQVRQSQKTDAETRAGHVSAAWQHINRALEALNKLTERFDVVRRENKLADKLIEFKKMHRVFIENAMATLSQSPSAINGQKREGAEFDLDEEYLKRLQEVLEMRREMMAELARILRDDPRLLRRYMNSLGDRSRSLRDQLTLLARQQSDLAMRVNLWSAAYEDRQDRGGEWQGYDAVISSQLQMGIQTLASDLAALNDRFSSWLPLEESIEQPDVAAVLDSGREAGTQLMSIAKNTHPDHKHKVMDIAIAAQAALKKMDKSLRRIGNDFDQPELVNNARRRLTELRELRASMDLWLGKWDQFENDKIHGVHAIDQELLRDELLQYVIKITSLETQLASALQSPGGQLPTELAEKSKQILELLDVKVPGLQLTAAQTLTDADPEESRSLQTEIGESFEQAEVLFDEVMQSIADELDKLPPQDPIASLLDDPTLDEILSRLESEQDFLEELGLTGRPSNLQVIGDMMRPGGGGGGGGSNSASSMLRRMMREKQMMQQMANRAFRLAQMRAAGLTDEPKRSMLPKEEERWNILAGQLREGMLQGDNKVPPEKYRAAIDEYFEQISKLKNVNEN